MRVIKIFIVLLLIAGIFGIVGLYSQIENLGVVSTFYHDLLLQSDWLFYFYQIVLITLIILLFLIFWLVVFKPITENEIRIKKEMGQINLPLSTLESIARSSVQEIVKNDETQVKVKLTKKRLADVRVTVAEDQQLVNTGKQIQEQIAQSLFKTAQVETKKVKVIFKKKKAAESLATTNKRQSRVV
ncbi:alkaline shock response membrane anchor protein AmaP [Enterococcus sp. 5H]|uniref:alkaline shock response membrane anchor protein AmaP n=1 Tax=Enterococcus sp. 5H TaxID=1229490 RepID=UPI00230308DE|nr:alkaline shock response membrane anchor protein AmaP [Enterococcus sp. 5H]MDA9471704.1 hypothetical protein [Enterococcus sp. 5H]